MIQSNDVKSILFNEAELDAMTTRIAAEIDRDFANSERRLVMVCILKGAVMFFVDLIRKVRRPLDLEFMKVSSYGAGTSTSGNLAIHLDLKLADLSNTDILLVEDCESVEVGEPGIFLLDGSGYFKIFGGDRLISLNKIYGDIMLKDFQNVWCGGRVIGKLKRR